MLFLVLVLIIAIMAIVFAVTNTGTVAISILVAQFPDVPISLLVVIPLLIGMLITSLGLLPSYIRNRRTISAQRKKITGLEKSVAEQQSKVEELQLKLNPPVVVPPVAVPPVAVPQNSTPAIQPSIEPSDSTNDPAI